MKREVDRVSLVAGLVVTALGLLLLLDRTGVIDLGYGYAAPAVAAALGAILLVAGLAGPRR